VNFITPLSDVVTPQNEQFQIEHTSVAISKENERGRKVRARFMTNTTEGIHTLMMWLGLRGQGFLRAMLAVA
jgi:hypothetical protein